ncbi:MAG TPA: riboflavin synthase [Vicinamibacterales bacterium]|nr:riboflavin synthase [Vicinamibacterales bacterium]
MFTGLIEDVGRIVRIEPSPAGRRIEIATPLAAELAAGDSLAVNGVCLTVSPAGTGTVGADVGPETLRVTTLGGLSAGQTVNLERSMRADSRFGGHFVQGHVDGAGVLTASRTEGEARWLTVAFPADLARFLVPKGSVAVDGISLTVAALRGSDFDVMIVPFTWQATNLSTLHIGDRVNLECDLIGKYVARMLEARV